MKADFKDRFVALDSLRGICAIIVAIYHFKAAAIITSLPFVKNGFLFVDFFFVLSGFVIAANYQTKLQTRQLSTSTFMFLRLGRIYPLHFFVLLLFVAVALSKSGHSYSFTGFAIVATLSQAFTPDQWVDRLGVNMWNFPSWSIAAEMWTYLTFAVLCWRIPAKSLFYGLLTLAIICPVILVLTSDRYENVFFFPGAIPRCLYGFSLGVLAFQFWRAQGERFRSPASSLECTAAEVLCIAACLVIVALVGAGKFSSFCTPVFTITILIFARAGGAISTLLRTSPMVLLGALSYSIYMTHEFIQSRLLNLISLAQSHSLSPVLIESDSLHAVQGHEPWTDLMVLVMVCIVVLASSFTFRWIEEPLRKASKTMASSAAIEVQSRSIASTESSKSVPRPFR